MVVFSDANDLTDFHNCRTEDWKLPLVSIYVASLYGIVCANFYPAMCLDICVYVVPMAA